MARHRQDIPVGPPTRKPAPVTLAAERHIAFRPSSKRAYDAVVLVFAFVAFVLRLLTIDTRGLWLDEATTVFQTSGTLLQTIQSQIGGTHPPLFHILMHFWLYGFGTGEVTIRMFALIFGVAAIPVAYWVGTTVYDRRVGLIAAGLLTVAPFHIWYSQEARMYSMLMMFALLSVGAFVLALERNDRGSWFAYFIFTLMGAFTQYLFLLLVIGQGIYYVLFEVIDREVRLTRTKERKATVDRPSAIFEDVPTLKAYVIVTIAIAIPVLIWLNWAVFFPPNGEAALVGAVTNSGLGYGAPPPTAAIRFNDVVETVVEVLFGSQSPAVTYGLVAMWPLIIYFTMLVMGGGRYITRRTTMLLCSASGVMVVWGLGQWQGVVLLSRYLIPMAAPALILLASVLAQMADRARRITISVIVVVCLLAYVTQSFDPNTMLRYSSRESIYDVAQNAQPTDIILYEPMYIDVLVNYYLPKNLVAYGFPRFGAHGEFRDTKAMIYQDLSRIVGPAKRVWVIRAFQNVPAIGYQAYLTDQWFKAHGYARTQRVVLNKGEYVLFTSAGATPTVAPAVAPAPASAVATSPGGGGKP